MSRTDEEIVSRFNIKKTDKILDIGGSAKQHSLLKIDTLVDIVTPEETPYTKSKLKTNNFVRLDITKEKLPFKDKEFDFVICTHTLEDLYNPFMIIDEMSRVGKRGYIATPSFGNDIVYSHYNLTDWFTGGRRTPGFAHHKWLFYLKKGVMQILPKNYSLLSTSEFQVTKWIGEEEFEFPWEGKIKYQEINDINFHVLISEYRKWFNLNKLSITKGRALFFIDNPFYFIKESIKYLIRKH